MTRPTRRTPPLSSRARPPQAPETRDPGAANAEPATRARAYGGVSQEDRRADRRDRLIRAAVAVSSRVGREGASVAAICAEAGLTARYFYESFPNRDALFLAAFQRVQDEFFNRIAPYITAKDPVRGALTGFFSVLAEHPGPARVFLLDLDEHDPEMKKIGRDADRRFGALFVPDESGTALSRAGASGAIIQIARRWVELNFDTPVDSVVRTALAFARAAKT